MNTFSHCLVRKLRNYCSVLRDDGMSYGDNLPAPAVIAQEIVEDLQAALEQFKLIAGDLEAVPAL